jgi:hypothetical protein
MSKRNEATESVGDEAEIVSSRRDAFKTLAKGAAGALVVGGAASLLAAESASATDGSGLVIGTSQSSQTETRLNYDSSTNLTRGALTVTDYVPSAPLFVGLPPALYPAMINGWAYGRAANGVYAYSGVDNGNGVVGSAPNGVGVLARGATKANLELKAEGAAGPARAVAHNLGEMVCDAAGDLWVCVGAGNPGVWRKLAGAATSGALHVLPEALRAYDSRSAAKAAVGATTIVSLTTGLNGADVSLPAVPAGASAALINLTLTGTEGNFGFLQAYSAALVTKPRASVMNWSAPNDNVANEVTVAVDATGKIKVGLEVNTSHFIIDVVGYYR